MNFRKITAQESLPSGSDLMTKKVSFDDEMRELLFRGQGGIFIFESWSSRSTIDVVELLDLDGIA